MINDHTETIQQTQVFGHRGSKGTHPENTMISFQEAYRVGAEGIEFDVHLTKDGVPVVIHDETVERTTNGSGWIKDLTLQELKALDAGSWYSDRFTGEQIPTLDEILEWIKDTNMQLNIELKNGHIPYPMLEEKVLDLLQKYDLGERTILSSFNHYSLVKLHQLQPAIETAILYMEGLYEPWNYAASIGASALHCYLPVAHPELLHGAREAGMPVRPFTVNEDAHIEALFRGGCSAIITDWPEKALHIRRSFA